MSFPNGKPFCDSSGETITVDPMTGILRIDGIPVAKIVIIRGEELRLQFQDGDRLRSVDRGTRYIEVPLSAIVQRISKLCE